MSFILSTDSGGTFLDLVLLDERGRIGAGKALHSYDDPKRGIVAALEIAARRFHLSPEDALAKCRIVFHGTTVTTNVMVERNGAKTGLLCTKGFEDTLGIGRVKARTEGYDAAQLTEYTRLDRPEPIVPFTSIVGISERVDQFGVEIVPLKIEEVLSAAESLVARGITAIAVAFLHSYLNSDHERGAVDAIRREFPRLELVASHEVAPVIGEYERTNTAVLNAYLNGNLGAHLDRFEGALRQLGYQGEVLVMQSIGGVASGQQIRSRSVATLSSGPVGGVIGSQAVGLAMGERNIITTDMGGTSFDVGLIVNGHPEYARQTSVEHQILLVPGVDVKAIGAGGGSIVWLDENSNIRIGPASAGARPGPASYGFGGEQPTITDADIILGFVDPCGIVLGDRTADRALAVAAMKCKIADPLGMTVEEAADAVLRIVNNRMADLVRKVTVERGHDPSDFALFAYGGSGPAHCGAYGGEIGVSKIIIPPFAAVFSAYGIAQSDVKHSFMKAVLGVTPQTGDVDPALLKKIDTARRDVDEMAAPLLAAAAERNEAGQVSYSVDMRFIGQVNEVTVPLELNAPADALLVRSVIARFLESYEKSFGKGSSSRLAPIEVVALNADVIFSLSARHRAAEEASEPGHKAVPSGSRKIFWSVREGWRETSIFNAASLPVGAEIPGPVIVELFRTSVPVWEGQSLTRDGRGNLILRSTRCAT